MLTFGRDATKVDEPLEHPSVSLEDVERAFESETGTNASLVHPIARDVVSCELKYATYLERQREDVRRFESALDTGMALPVETDYGAVFPTLKREVLEALDRTRPETLHAASRIPGVTPAALMEIYKHFKKRRRKGAAV